MRIVAFIMQANVFFSSQRTLKFDKIWYNFTKICHKWHSASKARLNYKLLNLSSDHNFTFFCQMKIGKLPHRRSFMTFCRLHWYFGPWNPEDGGDIERFWNRSRSSSLLSSAFLYFIPCTVSNLGIFRPQNCLQGIRFEFRSRAAGKINRRRPVRSKKAF